MKPMGQIQEQRHLFRARPNFLAGCVAVVAVLILPDVIAQSYALKAIVLILATFAIVAGWFLLLTDGDRSKAPWRTVMALIASVYLVASLPVFLFEMSQVKWLLRHPWHYWLSMYVRPWVHWGYSMVFLSVIFSFLGRGRARVAFVTGSLLLMTLRFATGTWVY